MRTALLTLVAASALFAQPAPRVEFEVASIKPSAPPGQGQATAGVHVDGAQISAPDWIASARFDINATIPAGVSPSQIPEMLQALLADRFGLKQHREKRDIPVYALVVGRPPLKLKENSDTDDGQADPKGVLNASGTGSGNGVGVNPGHGSSYTFGSNRFDAHKLTMEQFTGNIERFADREVIDMTGLRGRYDFAFDVTPEDYTAMMVRAALAAGVAMPPAALQILDKSSPAALGDALQQVGLKLDSRKAPLDVLAIDDVQKTP